jgi:phage shock protein A
MSTDEELDRDWVPNGRRPQSTMARSFSAELMDIFRIENSISDLDSQVDQRKQKVDKGTDELASLEQRIKEMEERLRRTKNQNSRPGIDSVVGRGADAPSKDNAAAINDATGKQQQQQDATFVKSENSRPGTARATQQAPSSGNMPPTPGASEDGDRE